MESRGVIVRLGPLKSTLWPARAAAETAWKTAARTVTLPRAQARPRDSSSFRHLRWPAPFSREGTAQLSFFSAAVWGASFLPFVWHRLKSTLLAKADR